jgi:two-component system phosphate regulon sensor histidine kinase PhoR
MIGVHADGLASKAFIVTSRIRGAVLENSVIYVAILLSAVALAVIIKYGLAIRSLKKLYDKQETACRNERLRLLARLDLEQTIMDSIEGPLLLLDKERRVTRANRGAFNLFGESLINQDAAELLPTPAIRVAVDNALQGAPPCEVEYVLNGDLVRNYEVAITPFRKFWEATEEEAKPHAHTAHMQEIDWPSAMILMTEITAIKRIEEMRIDFIANISHELRTPLATLMGFIETIRGPARNDVEAVDRFLIIMQDQVQRMSRLVSDLLTLSRAELQEYEAPTDRINLIKLLGNLWASLELRAAEKGISIMVKSPRELPEIFGDWDQLIQAFTNLVENAIKYGPESSEITITAAVQQDGAWPDGRPREVVAVSVADQGEGMTRETVERLTERFFRSAEAKARRIPGTGLGLAIVKHIIIRHRGHLNIQSDIGRGTTFTALLPVAE